MGITAVCFRNLEIQHPGCQDRIILIFFKMDAAVCGDGNALPLPLRLCGGIDQPKIAVLFNGTSRAASADRFVVLIGHQRDRLGLPFHEVRGGKMPPVHRAPFRLMRVVLEKQVRFSVIKNRTVRII